MHCVTVIRSWENSNTATVVSNFVTFIFHLKKQYKNFLDDSQHRMQISVYVRNINQVLYALIPSKTATISTNC